MNRDRSSLLNRYSMRYSNVAECCNLVSLRALLRRSTVAINTRLSGSVLYSSGTVCASMSAVCVSPCVPSVCVLSRVCVAFAACVPCGGFDDWDKGGLAFCSHCAWSQLGLGQNFVHPPPNFDH